jgi:hypothetical protein
MGSPIKSIGKGIKLIAAAVIVKFRPADNLTEPPGRCHGVA